MLGLPRIVCFLIALLTIAAPLVASARPPTLLHSASIYGDSEGSKLHAPEGVGCTDDGRLLIADSGNKRLLRFEVKKSQISGGAVVKLPSLRRPRRVVMRSTGEAVILDGAARKLYRLGPAETRPTPVSIRTAPGVDAAVGTFALDQEGRIHAYDRRSDHVLSLDGNDRISRRLGLPEGNKAISGLAVDAQGRLYAVDSISAALYAADPGETAFRLLTAELAKHVDFPVDVVLDPERGDMLLVVDQNGSKLVWIDRDGRVQGKQLRLGQVDGLVYYPTQVCLNRSGQAFIADRGNHRVQLFQLVR